MKSFAANFRNRKVENVLMFSVINNSHISAYNKVLKQGNTECSTSSCEIIKALSKFLCRACCHEDKENFQSGDDVVVFIPEALVVFKTMLPCSVHSHTEKKGRRRSSFMISFTSAGEHFSISPFNLICLRICEKLIYYSL